MVLITTRSRGNPIIMPTSPEPFPPPVLYPARIVEGVVEAPAASNMGASALQRDTTPPPPPNSVERSTSLSGNILIVQTPQGEYAYWLQRKMSKTTRGSLRLGYRVTRLNDKKPSTSWTVHPSTSGPYPHEMAAVKIQDKAACEHSSKAARDPYVEFSALQAMAREDPDGVVVTGIVCADAEHIFSIMPYFGEGSLAQYVIERGRLSEGVARHFFQQIIAVSLTFL